MQLQISVVQYAQFKGFICQCGWNLCNLVLLTWMLLAGGCTVVDNSMCCGDIQFRERSAYVKQWLPHTLTTMDVLTILTYVCALFGMCMKCRSWVYCCPQYLCSCCTHTHTHTHAHTDTPLSGDRSNSITVEVISVVHCCSLFIAECIVSSSSGREGLPCGSAGGTMPGRCVYVCEGV